MRFAVVILMLLLANVPLKMSSSVGTDLSEQIKKKLEDEWVQRKFDALTDDEKIGQLIMVRAHSNLGSSHERAVEQLVEKYKVGGLLFFQGTPTRQAQLTNRYQAKANKIPLMVAIDGEWGLGMRLRGSTVSYPRQLMLGAINDDRLLYDMGKEVARQCRRLGVHVNFAPVVDVNNNINNPVINDRSFGDSRPNVTTKSYMYMMGMQDNGLMACAKHFPGHGDTDTDSHNDLPVIKHSKSRLDSVELYPFKVLAQHGLQSMMIAHLSIPSLDNTYRLPSSLSRKIVTNLLKEDLGYEGLIFTDGLEMQGVRKYFKNGEIEVKALIAGNDILLVPPDVPTAISAIKKALDTGELSRSEFEAKVRKVIRAKYRLGLHDYKPIDLKNLSADLNNEAATTLKRKLTEAAITVVRNKDEVIPFRRIDDLNMASVSFGRGRATAFQQAMNRYSNISNYYSGRSISSSRTRSWVSSLGRKDYVVVSFHAMSKSPSRNFGISQSAVEFVEQLSKRTKVVVVVFGSPYALKLFDNIDCVVAAYDEDDLTQEITAQGIFGGFAMSGRLPVTASYKSKYGDGVPTYGLMRLQYGSPADVGLDAEKLKKIDAIANEAINIRATPGLQVLVSKNNTVVFHKAYGHHTYAKEREVRTDDIFDMASVTKIAAATLSVMKLVDEGKVDINRTLGTYIPRVRGTNKENLIIKDVMAHHARLKSWIPFYKETVLGTDNPEYVKGIYSEVQTDTFSVKVADNLYMNKYYKDVVYQKILDSELRSRNSYVYSDLGFYLIKDLVESVTNMPFEEYVQQTFYRPLGLSATGFNPWERFPKDRIVPTERDNYFRNQTVQGYVHDMGSAMLGGVSGHAGLFSTANDMAIIMQMLMNGGVYGGKEYLKPETIEQFTHRYPRSKRRGIGFDMKQLDSRSSENMSPLASSQTYGHMGFTGICVWSDPAHDLTYIFFSNRTYPTMNNKKLINEDIRPRIQSAIYKAMR